MIEPYIKSVYWEDGRLYIIDQRLLPVEERVVELKTVTEVFEAIVTLAVRGAPAIGIAASYGVLVGVRDKAVRENALTAIETLAKSRPTAYNLFYTLERMKRVVMASTNGDTLWNNLEKEAIAIHREDLEKSQKMALAGFSVIPEKARVISHCNAGALATGGGGTSLGVLYNAHQNQKELMVYVDETRPLLQGSRLTAWELSKMGIEHRIIADNMAGMLMKRGLVDLVILGADRIALNGDFANKIGTYSLAVLAHHHGIPFYTVAPISTFDFNIKNGSEIPIEERGEDEVLGFGNCRTSPAGSKAFNPSFDVTPSGLLTAIITEFGVIYPPFEQNIREIMKKERGTYAV